MKTIKITMGGRAQAQQVKCHEPVELAITTSTGEVVCQEATPGHWEIKEHVGPEGVTVEVVTFGQKSQLLAKQVPAYEEAEEDSEVEVLTLSECPEMPFHFTLKVKTPYLFYTEHHGPLRMTLEAGLWTVNETWDADRKECSFTIEKTWF